MNNAAIRFAGAILATPFHRFLPDELRRSMFEQPTPSDLRLFRQFTRVSRCTAAAAAVWFTSACSDGLGSQECTVELDSGCWTFLGLEGHRITAIADTPWGLFVGTYDGGVLRVDSEMGNAAELGLDHAVVSSILFVPGSPPRLLVGLRPHSDEQTDAAVFASEDSGQTWQPWDGGLAARRGDRGWAYSLAVDPGNPERLFMGYFDQLVRSDDGGRTWDFVWGSERRIGGGQFHAILVDPARTGRVWAGGMTSLFTARVLCSRDWGDTWTLVDPTPLSENTIWALAIDSGGSDRIFAGAGFGVLISEDGGQSWRWVVSTEGASAVVGFVSTDSVLYAASFENFRPPQDGVGEPLSDLGLRRISDGGEAWTSLAVPADVGGAQAMTADQRGRLLIGTYFGSHRAGLWRLDPQ